MPGMKVTVSAAMRARDVSRPSPQQEAAAQADMASWPVPARARAQAGQPQSGETPRRQVPGPPRPAQVRARPPQAQLTAQQEHAELPAAGSRPARAPEQPRPGERVTGGHPGAGPEQPPGLRGDAGGRRQPGSPRRKRVRRRTRGQPGH